MRYFRLSHIKVVFTLLTEVLIFYIGLTAIFLKNLVFRDRSYGPSKNVIKRSAMGILAFNVVLKLYYKSSTEYLAVEDIAKSEAKGFGLAFGVELRVESPFCLSILLLIEEVTIDIRAMGGITEAQFL